MNKKKWYEALFENYAKKYDNEPFTKGTKGECNFLETEFGYNKNLKILDVGCGTGRHTIELTKRGYNVTGIDLSKNQIERAKKKTKNNNLNINFLKKDARNLSFNAEFDIAIMICEGGFPLMETDEMNFEILKNITKALKNNCKFIFTTLNALFPLYHSVEKFYDKSKKEENATYLNNRFDLMTFREHNITEIKDDSNNKIKLKTNERFYTPSEINWLLKSLDFKKINIFGAKLGAFSRKDKLTTEDFEMLVIAEK